MLELLAPAGGKTHFLTAVNAGADAVYFGLKRFSARASAENFDFEDLEYCLKYAKTFGVKAYAAMNTAVKDDEREDFIKNLIRLYETGVDGFILQDVFLGKRIKERLPDVRLHLSTQGGACNVYGAETAKEFGFSRVVAARETTPEDLAEMAKVIEVECFVQGALCTSFSGECYASAFIGGNSANRGRCKQPCRMRYSLNGAKPDYAVCLKDLSVGKGVAELGAAGVSALKIEGRMRRPEYVAAAVKYYKKILSGKDASAEFSALKRCYNRGDYTAAAGRYTDVISRKAQGHIGEAVGKIKSVLGNRIFVSSNLKPQKGDSFKILRNGEETGSAVIREAENLRGGFRAECRGRVSAGDEVRITTDVGLNEKLLSEKRILPLKVEVTALSGLPVTAAAEGGGRRIEVTGGVAERADSMPLDERAIREVFLKTDKFPFAPEVSVKTDGVFVARSVLNGLRRRLYSDFFDGAKSARSAADFDIGAILRAAPEGKGGDVYFVSEVPKTPGKTAVLAPDDYFGGEARKFSVYDGERYLYLLPEFSKKELDSLETLAKSIGGICSDNLSGISLSKRWGVKLFIGSGMNIFNSSSAEDAAAISERFALSKELSSAEAAAIGAGTVFGRGNIKLMDLVYCPYGGDCGNCPGRDRGELKDEGGRTFVLRRVRAGRCFFEVYNCADLFTDRRIGDGTAYNFVLYGAADAERLAECGKKEYSEIFPVTSGTARRGVE